MKVSCGRVRCISLVNSAKEFLKLDAESFGKRGQCPKTRLLPSKLQVRHVIFVDASFGGKVQLPPATILPELSNTFSELDADIPSHPYYRGVRLMNGFLL